MKKQVFILILLISLILASFNLVSASTYRVIIQGEVTGRCNIGTEGEHTQTVEMKTDFAVENPDPATLNCNGADTNKDGVVDAGDYINMKRNFGKTCSSPSWCSGADTNKDGIVDYTDLQTLTSEMGNTCSSQPENPDIFRNTKQLVEQGNDYDVSFWGGNIPEGSEIYDYDGEYTSQKTGLDCSEGCNKEFFNGKSLSDILYTSGFYAPDCGLPPQNELIKKLDSIQPTRFDDKRVYNIKGTLFSNPLWELTGNMEVTIVGKVNCLDPDYEYAKCNSRDSDDFVCCKEDDLILRKSAFLLEPKESCTSSPSIKAEVRPMSECTSSGECGQCLNIAKPGEKYNGKCILNSAPKPKNAVCCVTDFFGNNANLNLKYSTFYGSCPSNYQGEVPDYYCLNFLYSYVYGSYKTKRADFAKVEKTDKGYPKIYYLGKDSELSIDLSGITDTHNPPEGRIETEHDYLESTLSGNRGEYNENGEYSISKINKIDDFCDFCNFFTLPLPQGNYNLKENLPVELDFLLNTKDDGEVNSQQAVCGSDANKKSKETTFESDPIYVCPENIKMKNAMRKEINVDGSYGSIKLFQDSPDAFIDTTYENNLDFFNSKGDMTFIVTIYNYAYSTAIPLKSNSDYFLLPQIRGEILKKGKGIFGVFDNSLINGDSIKSLVFDKTQGDYYTQGIMGKNYLPKGVWTTGGATLSSYGNAMVKDKLTFTANMDSGRVTLNEKIEFEQSNGNAKTDSGESGEKRKVTVYENTFESTLSNIASENSLIVRLGIYNPSNRYVFENIFNGLNSEFIKAEVTEWNPINHKYYVSSDGKLQLPEADYNNLPSAEQAKYPIAINFASDRTSVVKKDPLLKKSSLFFSHCYAPEKEKKDKAESKDSVYLVRDNEYSLEGHAYSVTLNNTPDKNITKMFSEPGYISIIKSEENLSNLCNIEVTNQNSSKIIPGNKSILKSYDQNMQMFIENDSISVPTSVTIKDIEITNCTSNSVLFDHISSADFSSLDLSDYSDYLSSIDAETKFREGISSMEEYLSEISLGQDSGNVSVTRKFPGKINLFEPAKIALKVSMNNVVNESSDQLIIEEKIPFGWKFVESEKGKYIADRILFITNLSDSELDYTIIPENSNKTFHGKFGVINSTLKYYVKNIPEQSNQEIQSPNKDYLLYNVLKTIQKLEDGNLFVIGDVDYAIELWKKYT